ncbi:hypothetical protein G9U51_07260 [Calidifontibacter sp. DB0510]|uniref:VOC family protein n=1 Tax=Metallococcus carri TaxID=1656884 RepID=A0A967E8T2_9MICO|nr:hypothetical protein [Metallococcus carri]NHN55577.1 hypothetical protein [Metallococcus carri]NOP38239.1 hypothetical protein [Calidifontibacter sp. DB2511S]
MITAQAIRFSNDVAAMRAFCETLGLVATVTSDDWAVMHSDQGDLLLHGTRTATPGHVAGQTDLTFEVDDLMPYAEEFGGLPVDEAYGRSLLVTDPLGLELTLNEAQYDFYGYATHDVTPDPAISVCPVRFTDPAGPYADFLRRLGLRPEGGDDSFASFAADRGSVGLHVARPGEFEQYVLGSGAAVHLTFGSTGDPQELADRLRSAGHEVRVDTSFGTMLEIRDPDGWLVQVHSG